MSRNTTVGVCEVPRVLTPFALGDVNLQYALLNNMQQWQYCKAEIYLVPI